MRGSDSVIKARGSRSEGGNGVERGESEIVFGRVALDPSSGMIAGFLFGGREGEGICMDWVASPVTG